MMPYYPESSGERAFFRNSTQEVKTVSEYTGLNFLEVSDLELFDYWQYRRDAVIWNCGQTEEGREYLEKAYHYMKNRNQDKADRKALAEFVN